MKYQRIALSAACAAALTVSSAGMAMAGEVNGNGKELPLKGASICKFSGLNDEITADEPTRTQSYGTFLQLYGKWAAAGMESSPGAGIRAVKSGFPSPGMACNPNGGFEE
jgi:hypothetical protein